MLKFFNADAGMYCKLGKTRIIINCHSKMYLSLKTLPNKKKSNIFCLTISKQNNLPWHGWNHNYNSDFVAKITQKCNTLYCGAGD